MPETLALTQGLCPTYGLTIPTQLLLAGSTWEVMVQLCAGSAQRHWSAARPAWLASWRRPRRRGATSRLSWLPSLARPTSSQLSCKPSRTLTLRCELGPPPWCPGSTLSAAHHFRRSLQLDLSPCCYSSLWSWGMGGGGGGGVGFCPLHPPAP